MQNKQDESQSPLPLPRKSLRMTLESRLTSTAIRWC